MPDPVNLARTTDLTDPAVVKRELADVAGGLDLQADAADNVTGNAGVSYPAHFFRRAAAVVRAAAGHIPAPVSASVTSITEPAAPAEPPEPPKTAARKENAGAK